MTAAVDELLKNGASVDGPDVEPGANVVKGEEPGISVFLDEEDDIVVALELKVDPGGCLSSVVVKGGLVLDSGLCVPVSVNCVPDTYDT